MLTKVAPNAAPAMTPHNATANRTTAVLFTPSTPPTGWWNEQKRIVYNTNSPETQEQEAANRLTNLESLVRIAPKPSTLKVLLHSETRIPLAKPGGTKTRVASRIIYLISMTTVHPTRHPRRSRAREPELPFLKKYFLNAPFFGRAERGDTDRCLPGLPCSARSPVPRSGRRPRAARYPPGERGLPRSTRERKRRGGAHSPQEEGNAPSCLS